MSSRFLESGALTLFFVSFFFTSFLSNRSIVKYSSCQMGYISSEHGQMKQIGIVKNYTKYMAAFTNHAEIMNKIEYLWRMCIFVKNYASMGGGGRGLTRPRIKNIDFFDLPLKSIAKGPTSLITVKLLIRRHLSATAKVSPQRSGAIGIDRKVVTTL